MGQQEAQFEAYALEAANTGMVAIRETVRRIIREEEISPVFVERIVNRSRAIIGETT